MCSKCTLIGVINQLFLSLLYCFVKIHVATFKQIYQSHKKVAYKVSNIIADKRTFSYGPQLVYHHLIWFCLSNSI